MKADEKKAFYRFITIVLPLAFIFLTLMSCGPEGIGLITHTPTPPTPSLTPTPTKRDCPPPAGIITPERATIPSYLVIVLYDPDEPRGAMDYVNGQNTSNVLDFIREVFQNIVQPGDHYAAFRLGCRDYSCARVINNNSPTLEAPLIAATPSPQSTLTPASTPTFARTEPSLFEKTQSARDYGATLTVQAATATEMAFEDDCAQIDWEESYAAQNAAWEATKAAAGAEFLAQIESDLNTYQSDVDDVPTPYDPHVLFEGLRDATIILQNECSKYDKCVLIIFDDLEEWRMDADGYPDKPENMEIDFTNTEIITVMLRCADIYQPDCRDVQNIWTPEFDSYGSLSVEYCNGKDLEEFLINYLRRQ